MVYIYLTFTYLPTHTPNIYLSTYLPTYLPSIYTLPPTYLAFTHYHLPNIYLYNYLYFT
jgi:hypothetical protein